MLVGSIRGLKVNSIAMPILSEAEFKIKPAFESDYKRTTGSTLISLEDKVEAVEGVQVDASDTTIIEDLKSIAKTGAIVPISFEMQGGQIWSVAGGTLSMGDYSTKTGVQEITLIPASDWIKS